MMDAGTIQALSNQAAAQSLLKTLDYESDAFYEIESEVCAEMAKDNEMEYEEFIEAYGASPEIHEWPSAQVDRLIEALQAEVKDRGVDLPQPFAVHEGFDPGELRGIPNFGSYRPAGFEKVDDLFVDKSGFGATDEPALTFGQFCGEVQRCGREHGYPVYLALTEEGQFQAYVSVFTREA